MKPCAIYTYRASDQLKIDSVVSYTISVTDILNAVKSSSAWCNVNLMYIGCKFHVFLLLMEIEINKYVFFMIFTGL